MPADEVDGAVLGQGIRPAQPVRPPWRPPAGGASLRVTAGAARTLARSRPAGALAGAAVTALLLWRAGLPQAWSLLGRLQPWQPVAVVALNLPITLLRGWRTRLVLTRLGARVPMRRIVGAQLVGQTLSGLTPAATGDLSRAYLWHRQDGVPVASGVVTVIFERVDSLLLLGVTGVACLAPLAGAPAAAAALLVLAAVGAMAPWLAGRALRSGIVPRPRLRGRRGALLASAGADVARLCADGRLMWAFAVQSAAVFVLSGLQVLILVAAVGGHVSWYAAVGVYGLSQALGSLSGLPFGLGAGDATVVGVLARAGAGTGAAVAVAVLLRAAVTLPVTLGGAAVWLHETLAARRAVTAAPARAAVTRNPG